MAGIFYTDVPSANKQAESWMQGSEGGLRRRRRRDQDKSRTWRGPKVWWSDEMKRSTRACLFPHLFTAPRSSLPWDRYTARPLAFHLADEGEHWCRGFHLASLSKRSLKYEYEAAELALGDVWQQPAGVARTKFVTLARVQALLSTTQINREQRLRHIYLWAQWWIYISTYSSYL